MFDGSLRFQISEKWGEIAVSIKHSEEKSVSASGGFAPLPPPPTRGPAGSGGQAGVASLLDPRYRLALRALAMTPPFAKS